MARPMPREPPVTNAKAMIPYSPHRPRTGKRPAGGIVARSLSPTHRRMVRAAGNERARPGRGDAMSDRHATIIRRWFDEVWNHGNVDAIDQLLAPGGVLHDPSMADVAS